MTDSTGRAQPLSPDNWRERFAASTTLFQSEPIGVALDRLAAAGFRWVEIADDFADPRSSPDVVAVRGRLQALGLQVHSLHLPIARIAIGHPDRQRRTACRRLLEDALDLAAEWRATIAVLHVNAGIADLPPSASVESRMSSIELVHQLTERCTVLGIRLALENLPIEAGKEGRYGSSIRQLAIDFPEPAIGFCLDTGHALCNSEEIDAEIKAAGARLASVHISDNDGSGDLHWPPGHGILDWVRMERGLEVVGYRGRLVFELLRDTAGNSAEIVLKEALDCVNPS